MHPDRFDRNRFPLWLIQSFNVPLNGSCFTPHLLDLCGGGGLDPINGHIGTLEPEARAQRGVQSHEKFVLIIAIAIAITTTIAATTIHEQKSD